MNDIRIYIMEISTALFIFYNKVHIKLHFTFVLFNTEYTLLSFITSFQALLVGILFKTL